MDVSPKTLREVEFREKLRGGYHPEDVDQFLEQVAQGLEVLHDRLRQAVERAQRAEAAATEATGSDETLKRTLVLAQRTADMAVQEAREQASRILAGAEAQAQQLLADTEQRARRTHEEALGAIRSELASLEATRQRAQVEIDAMQRWIEDHRLHLASSLQDALAAVERAAALAPAPASTPIEAVRPVALAPAEAGSWAEGSGTGRPEAANGAAGAPAAGGAPANGAAASDGAPRANGTAAPGAAEGGHGAHGGADDGTPTGEVPAVHRAIIDVDAPLPGAEDRALDEFFEDADYADDRRFGGRLRRRR